MQIPVIKEVGVEGIRTEAHYDIAINPGVHAAADRPGPGCVGGATQTAVMGAAKEEMSPGVESMTPVWGLKLDSPHEGVNRVIVAIVTANIALHRYFFGKVVAY